MSSNTCKQTFLYLMKKYKFYFIYYKLFQFYYNFRRNYIKNISRNKYKKSLREKRLRFYFF